MGESGCCVRIGCWWCAACTSQTRLGGHFAEYLMVGQELADVFYVDLNGLPVGVANVNELGRWQVRGEQGMVLVDGSGQCGLLVIVVDDGIGIGLLGLLLLLLVWQMVLQQLLWLLMLR